MKYAKLENGVLTFAPKNKGNILNYNLNVEQMTIDGYKPFIKAETEIGKSYNFSYEETETEIKEVAKEIIPDPVDEAKQRREYLDNLTLTSTDVERALYKAKGIDFNDVKEQIKDNPNIDIKAIGIELRAGIFERKSPYVSQIGELLGYSSEDLDYLFENKELPKK